MPLSVLPRQQSLGYHARRGLGLVRHYRAVAGVGVGGVGGVAVDVAAVGVGGGGAAACILVAHFPHCVVCAVRA